MQGMVIN